MCRRFLWLFLVMLPIGALTGLLVASVATYLIPKQYESHAVVRLIHIYGEEKPDLMKGEFLAPIWVKEIRMIKSRESMDQVIQNLDLEKRWNRKRMEVRDILSQKLQVYSMGGTESVSIRMRHANKIDAKDVVLEVANTCKERRDELQAKEAERQMQVMNSAISDQEEKADTLQQALSRLDKDLVQASETQAIAKRELETEQELLQTMKNHQMKILANKTGNQGVVFEEIPRIAEEPIFPNVTLNLVLGAVFGFFLSPLLALLVIRFKREALAQRFS